MTIFLVYLIIQIGSFGVLYGSWVKFKPSLFTIQYSLLSRGHNVFNALMFGDINL